MKFFRHLKMEEKTFDFYRVASAEPFTDLYKFIYFYVLVYRLYKFAYVVIIAVLRF